MTTVKKLWNKDFIMFAIGMELFSIGSELLKFVLPLYVFLETGSAILMGTVVAISTVPLVILAPIGGIVSDRLNKRKLLAVMNFATAIAIVSYFSISGTMELVPATVTIMLVLLGFEGLISPTHDASVPALAPEGALVKANSATFLLLMISGIGAPIMGGFILSRWGVAPVLLIAIACHLLATIVNLATKIPYHPQKTNNSLPKTVLTDIRDSIRCVVKEQPELGKVIIIVTLFGVTLGPAFLALNVVISGYLGMGETVVGLMRGLIAGGGSITVLLIGLLGERVNITITRKLFLISSISCILMGLTLLLGSSNTLTLIIFVAFFAISSSPMIVLGIISWSYLGEKSPGHLVGKIMSVAFASMMLGMVLGNYLYGLLLDHFAQAPAIVMFIMAAAAAGVALIAKVNNWQDYKIQRRLNHEQQN